MDVECGRQSRGRWSLVDRTCDGRRAFMLLTHRARLRKQPNTPGDDHGSDQVLSTSTDACSLLITLSDQLCEQQDWSIGREAASCGPRATADNTPSHRTTLRTAASTCYGCAIPVICYSFYPPRSDALFSNYFEDLLAKMHHLVTIQNVTDRQTDDRQTDRRYRCDR